MKKFTKSFVFFMAPIFIIGIFSEKMLRRIPNDYSYKKKYLDENSKNINILFLGNSHVFLGINPLYIKGKSFNAAHVAQSLDFDLKILEKYKNRWDNLQFLIVRIDYTSLYSNLETAEKWRLKNYSLYYDIKTNNNGIENSEVFQNRMSFNINRLYQFYVKDKSSISCTKLGWGTSYNSKFNHDLFKTGKTAAKSHRAKNNNLFNYNIGVLKQIIQFAKSNKTRIIFVTSPVYKSYVENLDKNQLNNSINVAFKFSRIFPNVTYINFMTDKTFNKEDFFDADHLNEIGAKKWSLKIDSLINALKYNKSKNQLYSLQ